MPLRIATWSRQLQLCSCECVQLACVRDLEMKQGLSAV